GCRLRWSFGGTSQLRQAPLNAGRPRGESALYRAGCGPVQQPHEKPRWPQKRAPVARRPRLRHRLVGKDAPLFVLEPGRIVLGATHQDFAQQARAFAHALFDSRRDLGIVLEELARIFAALAHALAVVGEPGAGLFDDAALDAEVEKFAGLGD